MDNSLLPQSRQAHQLDHLNEVNSFLYSELDQGLVDFQAMVPALAKVGLNYSISTPILLLKAQHHIEDLFLDRDSTSFISGVISLLLGFVRSNSISCSLEVIR